MLGYLSEVTHRVSATFMPTEMEDVASFLRGDAWMLIATQSAQDSSISTRNSTDEADHSSKSKSSSALLRYPLGATRWGHFIPLGIAGTALVSAATADSRAVLMSFFESSGFAQVFAVNLVPSEHPQTSQLQPHVNGGPAGFSFAAAAPPSSSLSSSSFQFGAAAHRSGEAGVSRKRPRAASSTTPTATATSTTATSTSSVVDVTLDGRYGTTAQAARHACIAAVRSWFEEVEEGVRDDEAHQRNVGRQDTGCCAQTAGQTLRKTQLQRVLVLVRCCADNRAAVSTRGGGDGGRNSAAGTAGRRHRRGDDPLFLFLHDLAALTTLYEARLATTACSVRPAVLLLPEDESYGGAMLKQRLREEVGYRYWVQLFLQSDHQSHQQPSQRQQQQFREGESTFARQKTASGEGWTASMVGRSVGHRNGVAQPLLQHRPGEAPLVRGCRLASFWGVLDASVLSADQREDTNEKQQQRQPPNAATSSLQASSLETTVPGEKPSNRVTTTVASLLFAHASAAQLEEALRRHPACFFVRPSNAPLCVFLMEALRRFPLLAPPTMLRHWQSTWTSRHSLNDLIFVFHTTVCPFSVSAANRATPLRGKETPDAAISQVFSASSLQRNATDLLDALLDASFTLAEDRDSLQPLSSNDFRVEQAVLFMLMYEALVQQREGRLQRIPGVVSVLLRLYDRHVDSSKTSVLPSSASPEEKVRYAVRHLLPYAPLNVFYDSVQQQQQQQQQQRSSLSSSTTTTTTAQEQGSSTSSSRRCQYQYQQDVTKRGVQAYPMNTLVLPLRRMSVAPQLHHTTLLSLLPPDASLLELRGVAEKLWEDELPRQWRHFAQHPALADAPASPPKTEEEGDGGGGGGGGSETKMAVPGQLSPDNFYHPLVPHAVRVLYLLTAHALHAPTEAAKQVPVVQLQVVCQLSDEQLLMVLQELQVAGMVSTNLTAQTARTLLDSI